ncbi:hypothetical protein HDU97_007766 [Phlyctochytrium planicorne]|nr:hypothetical protein HDU97_007766 [Phlyctochytrium planicorne]
MTLRLQRPFNPHPIRLCFGQQRCYRSRKTDEDEDFFHIPGYGSDESGAPPVRRTIELPPPTPTPRIRFVSYKDIFSLYNQLQGLLSDRFRDRQSIKSNQFDILDGLLKNRLSVWERFQLGKALESVSNLDKERSLLEERLRWKQKADELSDKLLAILQSDFTEKIDNDQYVVLEKRLQELQEILNELSHSSNAECERVRNSASKERLSFWEGIKRSVWGFGMFGAATLKPIPKAITQGAIGKLLKGKDLPTIANVTPKAPETVPHLPAFAPPSNIPTTTESLNSAQIPNTTTIDASEEPKPVVSLPSTQQSAEFQEAWASLQSRMDAFERDSFDRDFQMNQKFNLLEERMSSIESLSQETPSKGWLQNIFPGLSSGKNSNDAPPPPRPIPAPDPNPLSEFAEAADALTPEIVEKLQKKGIYSTPVDGLIVPNAHVYIIKSSEVADNFTATIAQISKEADFAIKLLGFDLECYMSPTGEQIPGVIQIAFNSSIVAIFQLLPMNNKLPTTLKWLIENPSFCKTGVSVGGDQRKAFKYLNVTMTGYIDSAMVANLNGVTARSLASIYHIFVDSENELPKKKRGSFNWDAQNLDIKSIRYAANDALASLLVWKGMFLKPKMTRAPWDSPHNTTQMLPASTLYISSPRIWTPKPDETARPAASVPIDRAVARAIKKVRIVPANFHTAIEASVELRDKILDKLGIEAPDSPDILLNGFYEAVSTKEFSVMKRKLHKVQSLPVVVTKLTERMLFKHFGFRERTVVCAHAVAFWAKSGFLKYSEEDLSVAVNVPDFMKKRANAFKNVRTTAPGQAKGSAAGASAKSEKPVDGSKNEKTSDGSDAANGPARPTDSSDGAKVDGAQLPADAPPPAPVDATNVAGAAATASVETLSKKAKKAAKAAAAAAAAQAATQAAQSAQSAQSAQAGTSAEPGAQPDLEQAENVMNATEVLHVASTNPDADHLSGSAATVSETGKKVAKKAKTLPGGGEKPNPSAIPKTKPNPEATVSEVSTMDSTPDSSPHKDGASIHASYAGVIEEADSSTSEEEVPTTVAAPKVTVIVKKVKRGRSRRA